MNETGPKIRFKITVIGDGQVGKTSLIKKFTKGSFEQDYIKTIGAQFSIYDKEITGEMIRLIFWDIAGQDDFNFLRPYFYRDSVAAVIVFSLEENQLGEDSFNHISNWYEDVIQFCGNIPVVLFANKVDLVDNNNVEHSSLQEITEKYRFLGYYLTSAKTGFGVIDAFNIIIDDLYYKSKSKTSVL
ncbi:MAG: Rab family GTPase [Candidatus Hermodarchaeota archaeon]